MRTTNDARQHVEEFIDHQIPAFAALSRLTATTVDDKAIDTLARLAETPLRAIAVDALVRWIGAGAMEVSAAPPEALALGLDAETFYSVLDLLWKAYTLFRSWRDG